MKKFTLIIFIFGIIFWFLFFWKNFSEKNFQDFYTKPSDKNIFTQGIFVHDDTIFMSSGAPKNFQNTNSVVGILEKNGKFLEKFRLDKNIFFGEGITFLNEKIFFITWKNQKWFILDAKNFEKISEFTYENQEGWGLASDGEKIFMSDGTEKITIFNENFEKISDFYITENGLPIRKINELEYIDGFIFANIWLTNDIVKIDPKTGKVVKKWNFDFLKNQELGKNPNAQEMNGIAFDKRKNEIILTGKMWENLYIFDKKFFEK